MTDFELHVNEWMLKAVKLLSSCVRVFTSTTSTSRFCPRSGRQAHGPRQRTSCLTFARDDDNEEEVGDATVYLDLARTALMDEWLQDRDDDFTTKDRPVVAMGVTMMTLTEHDILVTLLRVYDHSRSHFVFEICEESAFDGS
jgi:hypothetical protein